METTESSFRSFLEKKGLRCTSARLAILRVALSSKGHFEADDLFIHLRGKRISRASVYRTLSLLVEAGIVRKTPCDVMQARYEPMATMGDHDHLVCLRCGRIIEFHDEGIESIKERVAHEHRFELLTHRLILSGYCDRCR